MVDIIQKLLPIFLVFFAAFAAKQCRLLLPRHGEQLLRLAFFVTIPPLVFVSALRLQLSAHLSVFLVLPIILALASFVAGRLVLRGRALPPHKRAVLLSAPMAVNSGFVLPFVLALFGSAGAARVVLFNAVNNPILFIWVYALVAAHHQPRAGQVAKRVLLSPPLWALALGLAGNALSLRLEHHVASALLGVGNLTSWLIIAGLGLLFAPKRDHFRGALYITALRIGLGLLVGTAVVLLWHLHGIDRTAVLLLAAAPVGFNLITFAAVEQADTELAASAVSYSLLFALAFAPFIVWLAST